MRSVTRSRQTWYMQKLPIELHKDKESPKHFKLSMIPLDHLTNINSVLGHNCIFLLLIFFTCAFYMVFVAALNVIHNQGYYHSVESPSMVDPQWNIWYWGSKWNLHTVCWSAVGCEWGTTSVYFGITYVCFIPSRLPVFVWWAPVPTSIFFYFCENYHLNYTYKIFKKFNVGLKFEWGL